MSEAWPILLSWTNWQLVVPPARATTLFRRLYRGLPPPAYEVCAVLNIVHWSVLLEIPGIVQDVPFEDHDRPVYSQRHMIPSLRAWVQQHRPMLVDMFDAAMIANVMDPTWLPTGSGQLEREDP